MPELCFNTMNRSAYLLGDEDPDLPGQIRAAAGAGFQAIGPDSYSIAAFCRGGGRVEDLDQAIRSAGLRCFELPTLLIDADAAGNRERTEELLGYAKVLRPDFVQLNVDSQTDATVLDGLRRAGEHFGALGARLAIEYLPWLPEVRNLRSTRALLERAGVPGAGILVDTWHFTLSDDSWEELEALPLEEIAYLQFDDHPPLTSDDLVAETLGRRVMPGEGHFELERFCKLLRAKGYTETVSCEILSDATRRMDLDAFAAQVYQSSRRFWPPDEQNSA